MSRRMHSAHNRWPHAFWRDDVSRGTQVDEAQEQQANTIIGHMEASGCAPPRLPFFFVIE